MRTQTHRQRPTSFTEEEKKNYCLKWANSGQSKAAFCQSQGITKSAFYAWCQKFNQANPSKEKNFSPVTIKSTPTIDLDNIINLEICLSNQTKIFIPMQKSSIVSFIQELCHATKVIQ